MLHRQVVPCQPVQVLKPVLTMLSGNPPTRCVQNATMWGKWYRWSENPQQESNGFRAVEDPQELADIAANRVIHTDAINGTDTDKPLGVVGAFRYARKMFNKHGIKARTRPGTLPGLETRNAAAVAAAGAGARAGTEVKKQKRRQRDKYHKECAAHNEAEMGKAKEVLGPLEARWGLNAGNHTVVERLQCVLDAMTTHQQAQATGVAQGTEEAAAAQQGAGNTVQSQHLQDLRVEFGILGNETNVTDSAIANALREYVDGLRAIELASNAGGAAGEEDTALAQVRLQLDILPGQANPSPSAIVASFKELHGSLVELLGGVEAIRGLQPDGMTLRDRMLRAIAQQKQAQDGEEGEEGEEEENGQPTKKAKTK